MFHTQRFRHRDQSIYKDQDIGFEHKQICPDIHYHADIHLLELKNILLFRCGGYSLMDVLLYVPLI